MRRGKLAATDTEKAEVLSEFFASVFTVSQASLDSHIPEALAGDWGSKIPPTVREEQV